MTISSVKNLKEEKDHCPYCESKLSSNDSSCPFCGTSLSKVALQEEEIEKESESQKLKKIAREILSMKKAVEEARTQLAIKEEEFRDVEFENARRLAATPPETGVDITRIQTEIEDMTASLEAKEDYSYLLVEKAQRVYPKYFKR